MIKYIAVFLQSLLIITSGYKTLHLPIPCRSTFYSQYFIGRELVRNGHEVHIVVHWSFPISQEWQEEAKASGKLFFHRYGNDSIPKFNMDKFLNSITMDIMSKNDKGPEHLLVASEEFNTFLTRDLLENSEELMIYLENQHFDIAVADTAFFFRQQAFIPHRLKLQTISYADLVEPWLVRMPWFPSVYSPLMGVEKKNSTFFDRLLNSYLQISSSINPPSMDPDVEILKRFCKHCEIKSSNDIISDSLLYLIPEDPVLSPVRPTPANVIRIGGLTTEPLRHINTASIPLDYLDFIEKDGKSEGTVIVSFGSLVPRYPEYLSKMFLEAFSRLPQYKFIWRFENNLNFSIPKNIKIVDWLAQKEILGHKSVKLFITHSGNNGQFESLYQGVPMLAVFIFADQMRNARRIAERGYGEEMDLFTMETEALIGNIKKIAEDPSYKERVMKASEIFKSRPDSPAERAAFWIEHVIKFGGDHLKPAGNDLYFWQYLCIDVLLFLQAIVVVGVLLVVFLIKGLIGISKKIFQDYLDSYNVKKSRKQH